MFDHLDSIPAINYPSIASDYCRLSPDQYCRNHLENWLEERGRTLQVYRDWLVFRLSTDSLPLVDIDCDCTNDFLLLDNLNALG